MWTTRRHDATLETNRPTLEMSRNSRRGVIFDDDDANPQPNIIHNPNYDLGEEEAPLQRPRPPDARAQCYKTFYGRNLRIFKIS